MTFIKNIQYCYDPYHDVVWITFVDFSMSCAYSFPIDRRVDMIEVVDYILSGDYIDWF